MALHKPQEWTSSVGSVLERKCAPKRYYFSLKTSCSFVPTLSAVWRSRCTTVHVSSPYRRVFLLTVLFHGVLCCLSCFSHVHHEEFVLAPRFSICLYIPESQLSSDDGARLCLSTPFFNPVEKHWHNSLACFKTHGIPICSSMSQIHICLASRAS